MLAAAEAADVQEDEIFGKDKRGDEMPDWASDRAKRLAKIQEAMAALEADAKSAAAIRANWCPWSRPSKTISAASQSRPQRTLATAANPISKRS
jgi:hypothetical protein